MTPGVEVIAPEASIYEAAEKMRHRDVGPLPVCDGERPDRHADGSRYHGAGGGGGSRSLTARVRDVMTPDVVYGFDDQDARTPPV
jgi:CBS domain-containing protein